jgi:hypothetical protein
MVTAEVTERQVRPRRDKASGAAMSLQTFGRGAGGVRLHSEYLELSPRIICTPPGQGHMDAPRRRVKVPGYAASGKPIPGAGIKFETCAAQRSSAAFFSAAYL